MRDDLKKVICEKERTGDRSYSGGRKNYEREHLPARRNHEDAGEEFVEFDSLPKHESMTARLGWEKRRFSENLGALKGLIKKNVGKNWDKLFSRICDQVSPTGTNIERHVHQHLPDYIETMTRMGESGVEIHTYGYHGRFGGQGQQWVPLKAIEYPRADYYVHPVTRCITKFKNKKGRKSRYSYRNRVQEITRIDLDAEHQLHKINNLWWVVTLAVIPQHAYKKETKKVEMNESKTVFYRTREYIELPSPDIIAAPFYMTGQYSEESLTRAYGRKGVYGLRKCAANHKTLKANKLAA